MVGQLRAYSRNYTQCGRYVISTWIWCDKSKTRAYVLKTKISRLRNVGALFPPGKGDLPSRSPDLLVIMLVEPVNVTVSGRGRWLTWTEFRKSNYCGQWLGVSLARRRRCYTVVLHFRSSCMLIGLLNIMVTHSHTVTHYTCMWPIISDSHSADYDASPYDDRS